ncbi:hypothetical protein Tco_0489990 [Tanacetum coccineum]
MLFSNTKLLISAAQSDAPRGGYYRLPNQHDVVLVVPKPVLEDEDEDLEEDEFKEEEDPQEDEDDIEIDIEEDENKPGVDISFNKQMRSSINIKSFSLQHPNKLLK